MSKESKLIPELRFPEFKKEGEWGSENLGGICDVRDGTHDSPKYVSEGYPLITSKNLLIDGTMDFTNVNYLTEYDYIQINKRSKVDIGDILFGMIGTIGNPVIVKKDGFAIKNVALIKSKGQINQDFLLHQLKSDFIGKQFERVNAGGILKFIALGIIRDLNTLVPKPQEQQKIASCLSSLDEVIAAHSQKLALLKDHKKGLMQNLFPQEGEKVPKYRFKEFEKDGEWVEKKLGDSATFINGRAYKQEELLEIGKYRVLRVGNFFTNKNWYYSDLELEEDKYCEDGDLLYAWSASFGPRVWRGEKVIYHYHIWKVLPAESISSDFLFVLLDKETEQMKTQNANGFALLHITKGTIESWECSIPESKLEQQKIASCLSSLDALITAQAEKVEQLKLHKKGLMQGLFPRVTD